MNIKISEIENSESKSQEIHFCEIFEEFNKEVPVKAELTAELAGQILKISGQIKAVLVLTCDKCLNEYNEELNIKVEEFFTKNSIEEKYTDEYEIKQEGFIEDLNRYN